MNSVSRCVLQLLVLFCLIGSVSAAAGQRLKEGSKPAEAKVDGFAESYCSTVSSGLDVCRARTSEDGDAEFLVREKGVTVNSIGGQQWSTAASSPDAFQAYLGDLDRSGSDELVIVSLDSVSLGMGVSNASVYIFDGAKVRTKGTPIRFSIQEFGGPESFVYDTKTRQTDILITYWQDYNTIDPKRGPGLYLVGKWFRYRNNKLEPITTRPILARRFLNSFAAERNNSDFENRRPNTWLKNAQTHKLLTDPYESGPPQKVQNGIIESVTEDGSVSFQFLTDGGERITGSRDGENGSMRIDSIGVWQDKFYLYPTFYSGDIIVGAFFGRLDGRRVRLETFSPERGEPVTRVWLLEK